MSAKSNEVTLQDDIEPRIEIMQMRTALIKDVGDANQAEEVGRPTSSTELRGIA